MTTSHNYNQGNSHLLFFIADNGEVYSWGNSEYDQLGLETEDQQVYNVD